MPSTKKFLPALITFAREPGVMLLVAICLAIVAVLVWVATHNHPPTLEETRAQAIAAAQQQAQQQAQQRAAEAQERATQERNLALCRLKPICKQYGRVRQECAIAGRFETCIRVKMGDEDFGEIGNCTNDGHVAFAPESGEPGEVECFFLKHGIH